MKKNILIIAGLIAIFIVSGCSGVSAGQGETRVVVEHQATIEHQTTVVYESTASEGGSNGDDYIDNSPIVPAELSKVDILNLDDGYTVEGFSSYGNGVILRFYEGRYAYDRTDEYGVVWESFSGYFDLQNGAIKIYFGDDDGGGYAIETHNGLLEEGYFYDIIGVRDDITITAIYRGV